MVRAGSELTAAGARLLRYSVALPVAVSGAVSALCALGAPRAT
jgi:hypothetical protein